LSVKNDQNTCQIFSHDRATGQWRLHVSATISAIAQQAGNIALAEIQARCQEQISSAEHYQRLAERGLSFGAAFRGMHSLWLGKNEVIARIEPSDTVTSEAAQYRLHPALLDAALQGVTPLLLGDKLSSDERGNCKALVRSSGLWAMFHKSRAATAKS
jgi:acyl transferase domain-containing protein